MHTHSKHQHPRGGAAHCAQCARSWPSARTCFGGLEGHRPAGCPSGPSRRLAGRMKMSVFERGDAPAPGHRGTQQGVQRSSCGAWEVRVRAGWQLTGGLELDVLQTAIPRPCHLCPAAFFSPATWTHCRRIRFPTPARRAPSAGLTALPRPRGASGHFSSRTHAGGHALNEM